MSGRRGERVLQLAEHLSVAGEPARLTHLLAPEADRLEPASLRARAHRLLAEGLVDGNDDIKRYYEQALSECGDDQALRSEILAQIAANTVVIRVEQVREAETAALEALAATPPGLIDIERKALYALAWARALLGQGIDDVCNRSRAAAGGVLPVSWWADRVLGQRLVWRGELDRARALFTQLLAVSDERGEPYSYALLRLHLCELELRIGNWAAAGVLLDEWAESSADELPVWPMYERCRALLEAGRGRPEEATNLAGQAIARAGTTGNVWDRLEALRAGGVASLLAHDPARAAESLAAAWEHTQREHVAEPGAFPVAPDLVEALVELGETDRASAVAARLRQLSDEQGQPWGHAAAKRCQGLIKLAQGVELSEGADELSEAAASFSRLGLRLDTARTLLVLGRAQRRVRGWAAARSALEAAAAAFDALGSAGWADEARSELARVAGRRSRASGELTHTEERMVDLAAAGLSNKEIAARLVVSVHTVEKHLSHAYAKLGVHSRGQLAGRLAASR